MKIDDIKKGWETPERQLCRQRERGTKMWIRNAITVKRKVICRRIVGQKEEAWRGKGQEGGRDQIGIKRRDQIKPKKSTIVSMMSLTWQAGRPCIPNISGTLTLAQHPTFATTERPILNSSRQTLYLSEASAVRQTAWDTEQSRSIFTSKEEPYHMNFKMFYIYPMRLIALYRSANLMKKEEE